MTNAYGDFTGGNVLQITLQLAAYVMCKFFDFTVQFVLNLHLEIITLLVQLSNVAHVISTCFNYHRECSKTKFYM